MRRYPNSEAARAIRRAELRAARRVDHRSRAEIIVDACRGRRVLDLGCVDHNTVEMGKPGWLHGRIADAAAFCVGADYEAESVALMAAAGFNATRADVTAQPTAELLDFGPFDLIVAGELIEHLGSPHALFEFALPLLAPAGRLLLTTPNPYALWRARLGQLGLTTESVDHVALMFPSGIAELAARSGMVLCMYATVDQRAPRLSWSLVRSPLAAAVRALRPDSANEPEPVGRLGLRFASTYLSLPEWVLYRLRRRFGQLGETTVYLLERRLAG